jgi:chromosome segregation protein
LGLLSGGERALTAIALLFSILKIRPVPFCILDEVEAALDEANVYRFSQYLKRYGKESQFIVITHRKGTMEEADVLYGVTMQESGVSKLVSVRLEDTNELVAQ